MDSSNLKQLRDELMRDEGIRLDAYQDTVGLWTIGVGHLLGKEKRMTEITKFEAEALLDADIWVAWALAKVYAPTVVNNALYGHSRERALVNMAFNLGTRLGGFKRFLAAVNAHDWTTAAREMMDSKWAKQVGARAIRLRDMVLTED